MTDVIVESGEHYDLDRLKDEIGFPIEDIDKHFFLYNVLVSDYDNSYWDAAFNFYCSEKHNESLTIRQYEWMMMIFRQIDAKIKQFVDIDWNEKKDQFMREACNGVAESLKDVEQRISDIQFDLKYAPMDDSYKIGLYKNLNKLRVSHRILQKRAIQVDKYRKGYFYD